MGTRDGELWTRRELLALGTTDDGIRRAIGDGTLVRLRPGVYADTARREGMSPEQRHLDDIRAAVRGDRAVVSHQSAAVVHSLGLWNPDLTLVHTTVDRSRGGKRTTRRHLHAAPLPHNHVTTVDGLPVTTVPRTVADLCRTLSFEAAVCVGDSAVRSAAVTAAELHDAVAVGSRSGRRAATRAVTFLDGLGGSVGESRSRVMLHAMGFPQPRLQVSLHDESGRFLARPDFLWDAGVIGEFDGFVKYSELVPTGSTPGRVLFEEKRREDLLRSHGWVVVRWVWADLAAPHALADRIRRAFELAAELPAPRTR
ncbi:hypothetical protein ACTHQY_08370 [Rhodococcoides corynebacterioides]|uniref:hypothetical protein n=1 Tax=Rhodococcoides corynebacterioides TaxID=53972 RepID=UPI003F7FDF18